MSSLVVPGQIITEESGYLRGHGSYFDDKQTDGSEAAANSSSTLISALAGNIVRVNKLISVQPVLHRGGKGRYAGEVGDLIVGRIAAVESKRCVYVYSCSHDVDSFVT